MMAARRPVGRGADLIVGHHPHVQRPAEIAFVDGAARDHDGEVARMDETSGLGCHLRDPSGRPRKALLLDSLGNFATKMATLISQNGMIQTLHVARKPSGEVDWSCPAHRLVFSDRFDPSRGCRLLGFLEDRLGR